MLTQKIALLGTHLPAKAKWNSTQYIFHVTRLRPAKCGLPASLQLGGRLDGLGEVARPEVDPTAKADAFSTIAVCDLVRPWRGKGVRAPLGSGGLSIEGGGVVVVDS